MSEETVSFNGGPEIPVDDFKKAVERMRDALLSPEDIRLFFEERQNREDIRGEINTEMRAGLESFCSSHRVDKKALKMAYGLWKQLQKDRAGAESTQFEYDKLAELLITA